MSNLSKEEQSELAKRVSIEVGETIRKVRMEKGITQSELAKRIFSDRQYLHKIETGKVGISIGKLAIIADSLGVSLATLSTTEG